jgi:hypothetical protein
MGRFFVILGMLAVAVAIALFLLALWRGVYAAGVNLVSPVVRASEGNPMAPNGLQKTAYLALLALLFALGLGLTGGL